MSYSNSIIFGPIPSRRFGISLGIDLSPSKKQCNFDCLYCELQSDINVAEVENLISSDQAWDLREKYLGLRKEDNT